MIQQDAPVTVNVMPIDDAKVSGASRLCGVRECVCVALAHDSALLSVCEGGRQWEP